jgi:hypothetical protein
MDENNNVEEFIDDDKAALEAASDADAADLNEDLNEKLPYTVKLSQTYNFEGKQISEVDLSGLEDLTTADAGYIDRVMAKLNYHPRDKFRDIVYTKHIAMKVTNLPIEFFNGLKWKDMQAVTSRIAIYFLF